MGIHQYDKNMKPDSEFIPGDSVFLVEGNKCRLLDGRRTAGFVEKIFKDEGMFRWRITKFEDSGKHWDLPIEKIKGFQFEKDSKRLGDSEVQEINELIKKYDKSIYIEAKETSRIESQEEIQRTQKYIEKWLLDNSLFIKEKEQLDFSSRVGSKLLAKDLLNYMEHIGMIDEEIKTAETFVLNPSSGEWIKGMKIVLAEMGLVSYNGKDTRTKDVFQGLGSKDNRRKYLINRLAFVRAYFNLLDIKEVVLYRGMSSEKDWKEVPRTFLSCTFNIEVGNSFGSFSSDSKCRSAYLIKLTCPVEKLFMTYFETEGMNRQYEEAEGLIIYDEKLSI